MSTVIKADFHWNTPDLLHAFGLDPSGRVQMAIDNAVIRFCMPYVPYETGTLANSPYSASPPGSGKVIYQHPGAHYLYEGNVYGPNIPVFEDDSGEPTRWFSPPGQKKHATGKRLVYNTDMNPLAGPHWFDRMKTAHTNDILREAQHVAQSR